MTYLAKRAFAHGTMEMEVIEVDFAVEIDGVLAAAADSTHEEICCEKRGIMREQNNLLSARYKSTRETKAVWNV